MFEGFHSTTIETRDSSVFARYGGSGPPVLLLHGHPRTSATWHRVAPLLVASGFTVVCPDVRGYGRSTALSPTEDHSAHSKRAAAEDALAMMRHLGHDRFFLVGHDRGSLVALRLALDHPAEVMAIAILDGIPVSEHIRRTNAEFATRWWHWFFFAQPEVPERVINADPLAWYTAKMDPDVMGAENYDEITMAVRNPTTVRAMLEDYRAGLTVDLAHEEADRTAGRTVVPPMLALWSLRDDLEELHGNPVEIWKTWADDVRGWGIDSGHHMAEEAPEQLAAALTEFFGARR